MQKIMPCLWFDKQAEEAADYYISIFSSIGKSGGKNSRILNTSYYGGSGAEASGLPKGSVMTVTFLLDGQEFMALNGGPQFKFTEAISLLVKCETQEEIDKFWEKLSAGGEEGPCGWLKDKYGLSWQVVPAMMDEMMKDKDAQRSDRVMKALVGMKKIDIKGLNQAYEQKTGETVSR